MDLQGNEIQKPDTGYAQVKNEILFDSEISMKAKCMFAYICAKPNNYNYSSHRISKEMKESVNTVNEALKELENVGLLTRKKLKSGRVKYYLRFTKPNRKNCDQPKSQNLLLANSTISKNCDDNKEREYKERKYKERDILQEDKPLAEDEPFVLSDELTKMYNDNKRHIQIIALYLFFKKAVVTNKGQLSSQIKRNVRAAMELKDYDDDRLKETMIFLDDHSDFKWTLETVSKYISEDLSKLREQHENNN